MDNELLLKEISFPMRLNVSKGPESGLPTQHSGFHRGYLLWPLCAGQVLGMHYLLVVHVVPSSD